MANRTFGLKSIVAVSAAVLLFMVLQSGLFEPAPLRTPNPAQGHYTGRGKTEDTENNNAQTNQDAENKILSKSKLSSLCSDCDFLDLTIAANVTSECRPLKVTPTPMICLYPNAVDTHVSKRIRAKGMFEGHIVNVFQEALKQDPSLGVLDFGTNLGIYSLMSAAMGRQVISVEPLPSTFKRLHKSIKLNHFEDRITVVTNALSNKRESVRLQLMAGNFGGTSILNSRGCKNCAVTRSIFIDDLLPVIKAKGMTKVLMKLDIEGVEHLAMAKVSQLFSSIKIPYVFLETLMQRGKCGPNVPMSEDKKLRNDMFSFLLEHGYTRVFSTQIQTLGKKLDPKSCNSNWPTDTLWVHESQELSLTGFPKIVKYSDDCVIYQSGNTWESVREKLQVDLDKIVSWTSENSLALNGSKTQAMIFGPRGKLLRLHDQACLTILNIPVKFVKQYNYLGVILDSEMTLQPLLKHLKMSLTNKIFGLRKIRKFLTEKAAVSIYKQTILPIFDYAGFLILACNTSDRSDLQKIQNDILCICFKEKLNDRVSIKDKMISLEQKMRKQLLWLMYKESLNQNNRKKSNRILRSNEKYIFKVDNKIGT